MNYFSQVKSSNKAELFLPQLIKKLAHSSPTFTKDESVMYWSTVPEDDQPRTIYFSKYQDDHWYSREIASFSGKYHDDQPFISHDGQSLYFASMRPSKSGGDTKMRMWKTSKTATGWGEVEEVGKPIGFWTPSMTLEGTLYFIDSMDNSYRSQSKNRAGIYRSELINGIYETSELLPEHINLEGSLNWCPYISPDESFLLFSSDRPGSSGSGDLYISFHLESGHWSDVINMGKSINTVFQERFPGLTPDGKQLFFTRSCEEANHHELYVMDAEIINEIRKDFNLIQSQKNTIK